MWLILAVGCLAAADLAASNLLATGAGPSLAGSANVQTWTVVECLYGYGWSGGSPNSPTNYTCDPAATSPTSKAASWKTSNGLSCVCMLNGHHSLYIIRWSGNDTCTFDMYSYNVNKSARHENAQALWGNILYSPIYSSHLLLINILAKGSVVSYFCDWCFMQMKQRNFVHTPAKAVEYTRVPEARQLGLTTTLIHFTAS